MINLFTHPDSVVQTVKELIEIPVKGRKAAVDKEAHKEVKARPFQHVDKTGMNKLSSDQLNKLGRIAKRVVESKGWPKHKFKYIDKPYAPTPDQLAQDVAKFIKKNPMGRHKPRKGWLVVKEQYKVGDTKKFGNGITATYKGKSKDGADLWHTDVFNKVDLSDFPKQAKGKQLTSLEKQMKKR